MRDIKRIFIVGLLTFLIVVLCSIILNYVQTDMDIFRLEFTKDLLIEGPVFLMSIFILGYSVSWLFSYVFGILYNKKR